MFEAGIIDPVKVSRIALQNAVSVSSLLLTTEATICDIKEELFTIEFKSLYDFSQCTNGLLPKVIASMNFESGDISYIVKFYARTRQQHNDIYDKSCALDRSKMPVICVETQRLNNTENDDFSFRGYKTEVIGTDILNKEFYEMLLLSCNHIDKTIQIIDDNCDTSLVDTSTSE